MNHLKISFFQQDITPEIGGEIAGYGAREITLGIHDPLYLNGLLLDDGKHKVLLLGYDLLGFDAEFVAVLRKRCAEKLKIKEDQVILTCTHTHSGPPTRTQAAGEPDRNYVRDVTERTVQALDRLSKPVEVKTYFYSVNVDANINRRILSPEAKCKFLPHFKELLPFADGPCDKELGMIFFYGLNDMPVYTLVNYAAHPLCSHAAGTASFLLSADYPGVVRRVIRENTGSECMFLSGACGDQFPKLYETGWNGVESMGRLLAEKVMEQMQNVRRQIDYYDADCPPEQQKNPYRMDRITLKTSIETMTIHPSEERMRHFKRRGAELQMELQFLALGDEICFVGVPGELLAEPGLEIKWNSPYRKTFLLYVSTGYFYYLPHGHAVLEGGYEGTSTLFGPRDGLTLVNTAVDGMYRLKENKN